MKIETTISLEPQLWEELNRVLARNGHNSLSELVEEALRSFLNIASRSQYDLRELELINANADQLNQEAEDTLDYQVSL